MRALPFARWSVNTGYIRYTVLTFFCVLMQPLRKSRSKKDDLGVRQLVASSHCNRLLWLLKTSIGARLQVSQIREHPFLESASDIRLKWSQLTDFLMLRTGRENASKRKTNARTRTCQHQKTRRDMPISVPVMWYSPFQKMQATLSPFGSRKRFKFGCGEETGVDSKGECYLLEKSICSNAWVTHPWSSPLIGAHPSRWSSGKKLFDQHFRSQFT